MRTRSRILVVTFGERQVRTRWVGPFLPGWLVIVGTLLLFAFTIYLGSVFLDRGILRESQKRSDDA